MSENLAAARPAPSLLLLRAHRDEILRAATNRGVSNISVFGSVVRGDATPTSDIDLLVDFERGHRASTCLPSLARWKSSLVTPSRSGLGSTTSFARASSCSSFSYDRASSLAPTAHPRSGTVPP
jgi:predicted nucleotidyltransferase